MSGKFLKVSEVNNYIKRVFQTDMILSNISIEGEISNFKHHYSGHMYFNLKDEKGKIKCIMFKGDNEKLLFLPKEGMKLVATGYISLYEKEGEYQFYIRHMVESGLGDLYKAYETLKNTLESEGLFKEEYKKPLPFMPRKVGVVTSATGAAVRDIINVISRRYPSCNIVVYPSLVQGDQAPPQISKALKFLDSREDVDVIIVGRGGGSIEELFCFNSEEVARTIHSMKTPVISAVGHETDFTIADFVSDLRAPTPSAAAELCVPDIEHLKANLQSKLERHKSLIRRNVNNHKRDLAFFGNRLEFFNPLDNILSRRQEIDNIFKELYYLQDKMLRDKKHSLIELKGKLNYLDPMGRVEKGYGVLTDKSDILIKSINDVNLNDEIYINLKDGKIRATVNEVDRR